MRRGATWTASPATLVAAAVVAFGLLASLPTPLEAADPVSNQAPLGLDEARALATTRALAVARARWDVQAAEGVAQSWTAAALPSVSGFAGADTGAGRTASGFERPVSSQWRVGARASVTLVDPGTWAAAAAARRSVAGREATVEWARALARQNATELFAQVDAERRAATALDAARAAADEDTRATEALVKVGLRPPPDAARTRASAMNLAARAIEASGRATAACARLQDLLALPVDGVCRLLDLPLDPAPRDPPTGEHPALVAAAVAVDVADTARTATIAGAFPTVEAAATGGYYGTPGGGGPGWSAGVSVDVPLPTGAGGALRQADADRGRAEDDLDGRRRELRAALLGAEVEWETARASREARREALVAADAAFRQVQERYRAGLEDVTSLLDARRARIDAEVALIRADATIWMALAAVEAARGVR